MKETAALKKEIEKLNATIKVLCRLADRLARESYEWESRYVGLWEKYRGKS